MSTKIKFKETFEIPEGIQVELESHTLKVKGEKGELQKQIIIPKVLIKKEDKIISFTSKYDTKKEKRLVNTFKAHINNMVKGVTEGYSYKLKICSGHFPITVELKDKQLIIKNFFGEKKPRTANILEGVEVKINGDEIVVEGTDKELTGQTAANIERSTEIKNRDRVLEFKKERLTSPLISGIVNST